MEGCDGLGQLSGADLGADVVARARTGAAHEHQLAVGGDVRGVHVGQRGRQPGADARHAHRNAQARRLLDIGA